MNKPSYGQLWDQFYTSLDGEDSGYALWDVDPGVGVARDYARFSPYLAPELPMVDFGCGTGSQTAYLGKRYKRVVGIDVSARAIRLAAQNHGHDGIEFLAVDEDDGQFFCKLNACLGDSNVYMRGVLHQVLPDDRPGFVDSLSQLMGSTGRLYFIEVADSIRDYLRSGAGGFSQLPGIMRRTLISRLPPRGLTLEQIPLLFPATDFRVLASGSASLHTNIRFNDQAEIQIPAVFAILAARSNEKPQVGSRD